MYPRRLTFIQVADMCMFCDDPKGETHTYTVYDELKMGYISCPSCQTQAEAAVKEWHETMAYGRAKYLQNADNIKIKRSSGEIEDGWKIDNPFIGVSRTDGRETLHCCNKENSINKWCYVDDLIEMNPHSEAVSHSKAVPHSEAVPHSKAVPHSEAVSHSEAVQKNLCIECGIDMGECNPRQFCGKWGCNN